MKNILCSSEKTLFHALELLQKSGKGIVFVVDDNRRLNGVLTDGDIRRLLLRGKSMSEKTGNVIRKKYVYANINESHQDISSRLTEVVHTIPIVDDLFRVVDYIHFDKNATLSIVSPQLDGNEFKYLSEAFLSTWISSSGEYIHRFESEFAKFCGTNYAVAVSNGTVALHLAMVALGIGKGDEVIVPDLTFAASANSVIYTGAKPVLVDIEPEFFTIDPKEIKKAITRRTRAIMPVHLYGQPCDMDAIMKIAKKHKLLVVEDCAEAHGAMFKGKKVGSMGDVGCFSFFANKIITTGEGGMCVTNSKEIYEKMLLLRDHGMSKTKKYWHDLVGYNYRMTNLQAAIGCAQLERADELINLRKNIEKKYRKVFAGNDYVEFQQNAPGRERVTWLVSALIKNGKRDEYLRLMKEKNIDVRPFFYSLGSMPPYKKYLFSNNHSRKISVSGINLPTQINLNDKELKRISEVMEA